MNKAAWAVLTVALSSGAWAAASDGGASVSTDGGTVEAPPDAGRRAVPEDVKSEPRAPGEPELVPRPPLKLNKMKLTQATIRDVVAYHQDQIQACYEKTLADKDKVVEGKLMTAFVITVEGTVKEAKVLKQGTTLRDPKLHACVVETISTFLFPKPKDKRDHPVEYPFNLKAIR
jgi:hypothetical protein